MSRRVERTNAWISGALMLGVVLTANHIAWRHLARRVDLSQDQLYAVSDATRRILGDLEDTLQVKTYFTGRIESGEVALAKARVEGLLQEFQTIAGPSMEVVSLDPSSSTQATADAVELGIQPITRDFQQGTQLVRQSIFFGILIRYRGREQVLEVVDPGGFEVQFVSAVYALVRDRRATLGWYGPWQRRRENPVTASLSSYVTARTMLARRHRLLDVQDLQFGDPVPEQVDILFVVRPSELHPRVAFEIDQFVQRGGRLVVMVDQADYSWLGLGRAGAATGAEAAASGLDTLLRSYGAPPTPQHVWDVEWAAEHRWLRPQTPDPETGKPRASQELCRSPLLIDVREEGMNTAHPVTSGLQRVSLSWAQPIEPVAVPEGVLRTPLLRSSGRAHRTAITDGHVTDAESIESKSVIEAGTRPPTSYHLAVILEGRFPSPFEAGAPAPFDVLLDDPQAAPTRTTDEPVLSRGEGTQVVVLGDADWLRDADSYDLFPFIDQRENQLFLMNLVDWLTLDEDLIDLRRRVPRDRELMDLKALAERELGFDRSRLPGNQAEFDQRLAQVEKASARARAHEWRRMLVPSLSTLALVLAIGLAWNLAQRRRGSA